LGGAVSLTLALDASDLLRGLVLVGTGARLRVLPALFEILARDYAEAVAFMTDHAWSPASPAELKQRGRETVSATRPSVTRSDFLACDGFDAMARLGEIQLPSLVIVGEEDRLTPPKYSEYLVQASQGQARGSSSAQDTSSLWSSPTRSIERFAIFLASSRPS
jgi:pimeloyl-ACP methyl ester carboxylesterase